jgi:hypothetical protein
MRSCYSPRFLRRPDAALQRQLASWGTPFQIEQARSAEKIRRRVCLTLQLFIAHL